MSTKFLTKGQKKKRKTLGRQNHNADNFVTNRKIIRFAATTVEWRHER